MSAHNTEMEDDPERPPSAQPPPSDYTASIRYPPRALTRQRDHKRKASQPQNNLVVSLTPEDDIEEYDDRLQIQQQVSIRAANAAEETALDAQGDGALSVSAENSKGSPNDSRPSKSMTTWLERNTNPYI